MIFPGRAVYFNPPFPGLNFFKENVDLSRISGAAYFRGFPDCNWHYCWFSLHYVRTPPGNLLTLMRTHFSIHHCLEASGTTRNQLQEKSREFNNGCLTIPIRSVVCFYIYLYLFILLLHRLVRLSPDVNCTLTAPVLVSGTLRPLALWLPFSRSDLLYFYRCENFIPQSSALFLCSSTASGYFFSMFLIIYYLLLYA